MSPSVFLFPLSISFCLSQVLAWWIATCTREKRNLHVWDEKREWQMRWQMLWGVCWATSHKEMYKLYIFPINSLQQYKIRSDISSTARQGLFWCEICSCAACWLKVGGAHVLNYSSPINLAVPIIQGSMHEQSLPASPSCEKWVMDFKGTHNLAALHSRIGATLARTPSQHTPAPAAAAAVCAVLVPAEKSTRLFGNVCQWVIAYYHIFCMFTKCVSLCLPICPHDFPLGIKIYELSFAVKLICSLTDQWFIMINL